MITETDGFAQITAEHMTVGLIFEYGKVAQTAPITKYMVGWTLDQVKHYCNSKKWELDLHED